MYRLKYHQNPPVSAIYCLLTRYIFDGRLSLIERNRYTHLRIVPY